MKMRVGGDCYFTTRDGVEFTKIYGTKNAENMSLQFPYNNPQNGF